MGRKVSLCAQTHRPSVVLTDNQLHGVHGTSDGVGDEGSGPLIGCQGGLGVGVGGSVRPQTGALTPSTFGGATCILLDIYERAGP